MEGAMPRAGVAIEWTFVRHNSHPGFGQIQLILTAAFMESTIADLAATLPLAEARMEVVLANLIEGGDITPNAITFHPRGLFARGYNRDILEAFWNKKTEKLELQVCREGMYDMLPKALFHPLKNTPTSEMVEDKIATAQQTIQEEADARRFFCLLNKSFSASA
jgi:hypothetical protein